MPQPPEMPSARPHRPDLPTSLTGRTLPVGRFAKLPVASGSLAQGVAQSLLYADLRPGAGIGRLELGVAVLELALSVPTVGYTHSWRSSNSHNRVAAGGGWALLAVVATLAGWILTQRSAPKCLVTRVYRSMSKRNAVDLNRTTLYWGLLTVFVLAVLFSSYLLN